mmetsp:Transcript_8571/g.14464  ORF Transcript_8571/g.14464 Transcript_8571/m.14464 type:complete len:98 (+) Transcript_8571:1896-2189(+)
MTLENLFNLDFSFPDKKIAVQYHLKEQCRFFTQEPSELKKLTSKLMRYQGWEVLDLTEKQFNDWKTQEKTDNLRGWLKEAKERQIQNGNIPPDIDYV